MTELDGRNPEVAQSTMAVANEYAKVANVYAIEANTSGHIWTPEGLMAFEAGDMIVSDIPPTHMWPVKREVFDRTYVYVPRGRK